jgi:hypothetical protein
MKHSRSIDCLILLTMLLAPASLRADDPARQQQQTIQDSLQLALGRVEEKPLYKPPTIEDRIAAAYQFKGTPEERLSHATKIARLTNQYLLFVGDDRNSEAVWQIMSLYYNDNDFRALMPSFLLMGCDDENCEVEIINEPSQLEINLGLDRYPEEKPSQLICIGNDQSELEIEISFKALSSDGKINRDKLLKLLKDHQYPTLNAHRLLANALQQAKAQNKRVIVQETATRSDPCLLLSRYLDRERKIWERDYIWIKLDHRWTGTREIMEKLRDGAPGGIPWWTILDANGKVLVTSNNDKAEGKNIGFPVSPSEYEHVRSMLKQTAIRLGEQDINKLVEALKQKQD